MSLRKDLGYFLSIPAVGLVSCVLLLILAHSTFDASWFQIVLWAALFSASSPIFFWTTACWFALCSVVQSILPGTQFATTLLVTGELVLACAFALRRRLGTRDPSDLIYRILARSDWGRVRVVFALLAVLSAISGLARATPLLEAVSWPALMLMAMHSLPRGTRSRRVYAGEVALVTTSLALSLVILEIGSRAFLPPRQVYGPVFEPHPEYIYLLKPNARRLAQVQVGEREFAKWEIAVSSQGFRDREFGPKQPGEFRVLMLGDSHTMGHVDPEDTIPSQLGLWLQPHFSEGKITVINAGLGGSGPLQQRGMLLERGLALQPDLVILQTNLGNDIHDTMAARDTPLPCYSRDRYLSLTRMKRQAEHMLPYQAEAFVRDHSRLYRELAFMNHNADLLANWLNRSRLFPAYERIPAQHSLPRPHHIEAHLTDWYPELEQGFELFKDGVLEIRAICESRQIPLVAYCVPSKNDIDDALWEEEVEPLEDDYTQGKACKLLDRFFEEEGIAHFSITAALRQAREQMEIHYEYDAHLQKNGNQTVARIAAEFLRDGHIPPDPGTRFRD